MKINSKDYRLPANEKVDLDKWPTRVKPAYKSKKKYHKHLDRRRAELSGLCTGSDCLDTVLQLRLPFGWHKPDGLRGVT